MFWKKGGGEVGKGDFFSNKATSEMLDVNEE